MQSMGFVVVHDCAMISAATTLFRAIRDVGGQVETEMTACYVHRGRVVAFEQDWTKPEDIAAAKALCGIIEEET